MKRRLMRWCVVAVLSLCAVNAKAEELTVYTAFELDLLSKYKSAFEQDHPDIEIKWVRDSAGIMTAKLLAEKDSPKADVVWGLSGSSLALLKKAGVLKNYQPKDSDKLRSGMNDPQANPVWYVNDVTFNAICFNKIIAKKHNLPMPSSWEDLAKPAYKGLISMPNPGSSGTGYMQVTAWLQTMGETAGWSFMKALDQNIAHYTHSGSKPCMQAAMGEVAIGISMATRGSKLKTQGAPIAVILPPGIGWEAEAVALIKESKSARSLVDWSISKKANQLYADMYPIVGRPEVSKKVPNYPEVDQVMADMNFEKMGRNRKAVLKKWSEKFDN